MVTTLTNAVKGTKPKLFRESGDFSGNRDMWKTRDNSGTLQKIIGTSKEISNGKS